MSSVGTADGTVTAPGRRLAGRRRALARRRPLGGQLSALVLVAILVAARGSDLVSGATVVFASIAIEALPFVLLGALVSATLSVVMTDRALERTGAVPRVVQLPLAALAGMAFPVCECGSVPVARRMTLRGLAPSAACTFMFAAPIVNPVVIASTLIAFRGRDAVAMAAGRVALGVVVAIVAGLTLGRHVAAVDPAGETCDVHEHHDHGGRVRTVLDHATADVLFMGRFVVVGAALAALVQTFLPTGALTSVAGNWVLAPLALMLLAFLLSLCSSADAFVGASFAQFGAGAQLAFLVFGPVLDLKLALLYRATFGRGSALRVAVVAVPLVFTGALLADLLVVR
jgi:uncharacterized membrane protein YraQ (UPF0718 family)